MKLTCAQMDILISFYIENELSQCLKEQVESHLDECQICASKYEIVKTMINEMRENVSAQNIVPEQENEFTRVTNYTNFKTNLSAYIDNELESDESVKLKRFTISNPGARKELEDSYSLRKMIKDSFQKTKYDSKCDFSKNIIKQLELENERTLGFGPAINLLIVFTISVLVLSTIILVSLSV